MLGNWLRVAGRVMRPELWPYGYHPPRVAGVCPPPPSSPPAASCGSKTRSCIASMIAKTHTVTLYLDIKTFRVSQFVVEDPRWVHSQTHMYTKYSP